MRTLYKCTDKTISVNGIHLKGDYLILKKSAYPDADLEATPQHQRPVPVRDTPRIEAVRPNGDMTVGNDSSLLPDYWRKLRMVSDE